MRSNHAISGAAVRRREDEAVALRGPACRRIVRRTLLGRGNCALIHRHARVDDHGHVMLLPHTRLTGRAQLVAQTRAPQHREYLSGDVVRLGGLGQ